MDTKGTFSCYLAVDFSLICSFIIPVSDEFPFRMQPLASPQVAHSDPLCLGKQAVLTIIPLLLSPLEAQILLVLRQGAHYSVVRPLVSLGSLQLQHLVLHPHQLLEAPHLHLEHHQLLRLVVLHPLLVVRINDH